MENVLGYKRQSCKTQNSSNSKKKNFHLKKLREITYTLLIPVELKNKSLGISCTLEVFRFLYIRKLINIEMNQSAYITSSLGRWANNPFGREDIEQSSCLKIVNYSQ